MKHLSLYLSAVILFSIACSTNDADNSPAQEIVDKAIEAHGGKRYENVRLVYDFRGKHYTLHRQGGLYTYTRAFQDSAGQVMDVLNNDGFQRKINGALVDLQEERQLAYSNSVNSVHYFAMLPYGLNDPAVNKAYLGNTEIKGKDYHLIKVTFDQQGGGTDYEDEFLYWINADTYTMDYLAYSYQDIKDGIGYRFRKAINPKTVGGIRFQDYLNYKPTTKEVTLEQLAELYKQGQLVVLSEIELENIQVIPN